MSSVLGRRGLRHRTWQAVLAVAALSAAVALPVVLMSVGGGVASHELAALNSSGFQLSVSGAGVHGISHAHNVTRTIGGLSGVVAASPILTVPVVAFNTSGAVSGVLAEGVVPSTFPLTLGPTESGLFPRPLPLPDPNDTIRYANATYLGSTAWDVLVSSPFAATFGLSEGSPLTLSPSTNSSDGVRCNVTGVFGVPLLFGQPSGAFAVLLGLSELQVLAHLSVGPGTVVPDAADTVEVVASSDVASSPDALAQLAQEISSRYQFYTVTPLQQQAQQLEQASSLLTGFYLALSSVGLTIGAMFLALVLVRRVDAERREIGIRRALGIPGRAIVGEVCFQGAVLAALGAVLGTVAGFAIVRSLATYARSTVQLAANLAVFDPTVLLLLAAGVLAVSQLASLLAARRALRLDLLEVLR